jgi:hypothetical protein
MHSALAQAAVLGRKHWGRSSSMNEHLMRALLYAGVFFATCTEEQCELDTAVKQLESLTLELNKLSGAEKAEFRAFMLREAAAHPRSAVAAQISKFAEAAFGKD